jgi:hypothetical protein
MPKITIRQVIIDVLRAAGTPLNAQQIYDRIVEAKLYDFQAKNPYAIVRSQLRRNSVNVELQKGPNTRCFRVSPEGRFSLHESDATKTQS